MLSSLPDLHAQGAHWVLDSNPRQWAVRKRAGVGGVDVLATLVDREECGDEPEEYRPLTDADQEAHRLYLEGVACSERGEINDAMRLYRRAAGLSESVAYHFMDNLRGRDAGLVMRRRSSKIQSVRERC